MLLRPSENTTMPCTMFAASRFTTAVSESGTFVPLAMLRATSRAFNCAVIRCHRVRVATAGSPAGGGPAVPHRVCPLPSGALT